MNVDVEKWLSHKVFVPDTMSPLSEQSLSSPVEDVGGYQSEVRSAYAWTKQKKLMFRLLDLNFTHFINSIDIKRAFDVNFR